MARGTSWLLWNTSRDLLLRNLWSKQWVHAGRNGNGPVKRLVKLAREEMSWAEYISGDRTGRGLITSLMEQLVAGADAILITRWRPEPEVRGGLGVGRLSHMDETLGHL
jgi:hypothetical protein